MKLRNKKTGEIVDCGGVMVVCEGGKPLAEINEEWEDYKPAEPLIKDEKIRKAVRAWYEALGGDGLVEYDEEGRAFWYGVPKITFEGFDFENLEDWCKYTIAELCGEEE